MNNKNEKVEMTKEEYEEYQQLKSMFKNIKEDISEMDKKMDEGETSPKNN